MQFILAEAVQDMINTGNTAQWHYEEGIKASFNYFQAQCLLITLLRPRCII
ncbi:MAG: hypothetical protein KF746_06515 [Chitinophagaceae bacterium]|nr:hypothetical protein [Chitinophagaceae bacterium]